MHSVSRCHTLLDKGVHGSRSSSPPSRMTNPAYGLVSYFSREKLSSRVSTENSGFKWMPQEASVSSCCSRGMRLGASRLRRNDILEQYFIRQAVNAATIPRIRRNPTPKEMTECRSCLVVANHASL